MTTLGYNDYKQKYSQHKSSARQRGIKFNLTYDQWLNIWLISGKIKQRGFYCMSRIKDKGAYDIGNVFIQTMRQNSLDGVIGTAVWTDDNVDYAIGLFMEGYDFPYIAEKIGRTPFAVKIKIYRNVKLSVWQNIRKLHSTEKIN